MPNSLLYRSPLWLYSDADWRERHPHPSTPTARAEPESPPPSAAMGLSPPSQALGNSNATMHSVFRLDRYLMNVIATKAEVPPRPRAPPPCPRLYPRSHMPWDHRCRGTPFCHPGNPSPHQLGDPVLCSRPPFPRVAICAHIFIYLPKDVRKPFSLPSAAHAPEPPSRSPARQVGMWDEHWNHWKKLIPLKQMISVLAEMVLLTKRVPPSPLVPHSARLPVRPFHPLQDRGRVAHS